MRPRRLASRARTRGIVAAAAGLLVGIIAVRLTTPSDGTLLGWLAAASLFNVWTWAVIWGFDGDATREHANTDDPGRRVQELVVLVCSVLSLGAVASLLLQHSRQPGPEAAQAALSVVSVALAWFTVHTVFTTRYARLYYADPDGGISFNDNQEPAEYRDFAYFAFTVGMAYAVSDTNVSKRTIRTTVLQHGLLSYLLGAVVIAATINLLISLPSS